MIQSWAAAIFQSTKILNQLLSDSPQEYYENPAGNSWFRPHLFN